MFNKKKKQTTDEKVDEMIQNFVDGVNIMTSAGLVEYPYIRQDNFSGEWDKVTVKFFVESITEEEAREQIEREA